MCQNTQNTIFNAAILNFGLSQIPPTLLRGSPRLNFSFSLHRRQIHWKIFLCSPRSRKCSRWPNYSGSKFKIQSSREESYRGCLMMKTRLASSVIFNLILHSVQMQTVSKLLQNSLASCVASRNVPVPTVRYAGYCAPARGLPGPLPRALRIPSGCSWSTNQLHRGWARQVKRKSYSQMQYRLKRIIKLVIILWRTSKPSWKKYGSSREKLQNL